MLVLQQYILGFPARRELFLQPPEMEKSSDYLSEELIGQMGVAISPLRPTGNVEVNGQKYDAATEDGQFIDRGAAIIVRRVSGTQVFVELSS